MSARILVVEDEPNIAEYLLIGLREEGYEVVHAADGLTGREQLLAGTWNLVLLDWSLPGLDGLEVLRQFRTRDRLTPVLFLTARDQVQSRVLGLDQGADDYLCKPFDFDELLARVRALIRRGQTHAEGTLSHGDVTIDLTTQRVMRAGRPLDLTAKELAILIYFVRNPGHVLSKSAIYEHVWHDLYDGLSNNLEMHIVELRRKLEAVGPRIIHTLRGKGYYCGNSPLESPEDKR